MGRGESPSSVIPAEAKRRAGTPKDFAAQGPRWADAFGDNHDKTEGVFAKDQTRTLILPSRTGAVIMAE
jgi:hypothetical protein